MEQSSKNQDCYFYYYSTCTKGDSCHFRHEPSALGCEVMCTYWQQGNCMNEHCNFRHMELKKNRKSIPCYWESQRGGCKKPHCPFLHTLDRPTPSESTINPSKTPGPKPVTQEWSNRPDGAKFPESSGEGSVGHGSSESSSFISGSVVDPIIVNFNEETDNEGNTPSPQKHTRAPSPRPPGNFSKQKTYEEERIDEIVEETAAYYRYALYEASENLEESHEYVPTRIAPNKDDHVINNSMDFEVLSLEEIKRRKRALEATFNLESTVGKIEPEITDCRENLSAESRKRKTKSDVVRPIKLRRSKKFTPEDADTAGKRDPEVTDRENFESGICDSTSDGKQENGSFCLKNLPDGAGDSVDDVIEDLSQLLEETS